MIKKLYSWDWFIENSPPTIKDYVLRTKKIPQSYDWHPENWVSVHTRIVMNRAYATGDIDIVFAAFFHDLGKVDTTKSNGKGGYSAHDHEKISAKLVKYGRDWIKEHANPYCVEWIVENHMRAKYMDEMKDSKLNALVKHEWFPKLEKFLICDSIEGLDYADVIIAGGNPFKYLWNKFKTFILKLFHKS